MILTQKEILTLPFTRWRKTTLTVAVPFQQSGIITTREGEEHVKEGDYLCLGITGEIWYTPKNKFEHDQKKVSDLLYGLATYQSCVIRYAIQIDKQFSIYMRGDCLQSREDGGWLVWNGESDEQYDVWITEKGIFERSYEKVG